MSNVLNQQNKETVWDFWQKLNHVGAENVPDVIRAAVHEDVDWNGSAPIDRIVGAEGLISDFWLPLLHAFPDLKRAPYVFMGGIESGLSDWAGEAGSEWVTGCGYLTGTFVNDWLGIPATGKKTNIWFGQFYLMRKGKIAESYVQYDVLAVMRQAGYQVLPPAPGAEGGKVPGPVAKDGILLTEQDSLESRKSLQLVEAMGKGLMRYVRDRDGGDMSRMEQDKYWHQDMKWYGPSGIGGCFTLEEFEDFHQRNWLHGFGDRHLDMDRGGRSMGFIGEGKYACGGVWDTYFSYNNGDYAGIPATGKLMTMRDFDWWKREGDYLIENWVPIDMIDLCRQMGVDLMERLRLQIEERERNG
ncbi:MAG: ester cyclase [Chloroflexi bacterium]|nr:ester cyclase [Chloroflexota bacterium]